jgi:hypothetical protein
MRTQATTITLALAVAAGIAGGCHSRSIQIRGESGICNQNVRVDIVGVASREEKQTLENMTMQEYWAPDNLLRESPSHPGWCRQEKFGPATPTKRGQPQCEVIIREKDPIWNEWKRSKVTYFFVLFDTCANTKNPKAWRRCLPLTSKYWRGRTEHSAIEIYIRPSGVVPRTEPKPGWE